MYYFEACTVFLPTGVGSYLLTPGTVVVKNIKLTQKLQHNKKVLLTCKSGSFSWPKMGKILPSSLQTKCKSNNCSKPKLMHTKGGEKHGRQYFNCN